MRGKVLGALLLSVAVLALIVGGLGKLQVKTGVESFLPSGDPTAEALGEVASSFGGDPIVVLVESRRAGELLAKPRLPRLLALEGKLAGLPDVASVYGPATVLNQIAGQAQGLLAELTGYRDGLRSRAENDARSRGDSPSEARRAGVRATADFDRRYGSLLANGIPGGLPTLHNERFVRTVVSSASGEPRPQWHFVVPASDAVAVLVRPRQNLDQDATERLVTDVRDSVDGAGLDARRVTVSGVPTVVSALGEQVRAEIPILGGVALAGVGAWFLLMRWTRWRHRILPLLTTALATAVTLALFGWVGLPVSLGAVAFLPILLGVGSDFMTYLHSRVGRRVVVSVSLATATAFGALAATPIPAIRDLGVTLAVGMVVALGVALAVEWRFRATDGDDQVPSPSTVRPGASRRTRVAAAAVVGVLATTGWALLPVLPLKADFQGFAADLPVLSDARHVESVLGSSGEISLALTGDDTVVQESLEWMRRSEETIIAAHGDQVRPTLSPPMLLQFLGGSPTSEELAAALRLVPRYLTSGAIRSDGQMSVLSYGVKLNDAAELQRLRDDILRILPPPPDGLTVRLTGLPMVAVSAHEAVSQGRYLTNALGILAAGAVLALCLRRRGDALRAVAAAAVATGLGLLALWLAGIALTPITVAVGSLTAAVGCEFTVVLAEAVRRGDRAIRRAVFLAAAASATGYAVLMLSELVMVRQFGALLMATVGFALASAVFVVWLTSPGRSDRHRDASTGSPAEIMERSVEDERQLV